MDRRHNSQSVEEVDTCVPPKEAAREECCSLDGFLLFILSGIWTLAHGVVLCTFVVDFPSLVKTLRVCSQKHNPRCTLLSDAKSCQGKWSLTITQFC